MITLPRLQVAGYRARPQEQGFGRRQFDVVIASNVLHTSDLRNSVKYVQQLLASGGLLVLLESTGPQRLVDLTFGLTEDWWSLDSDQCLKHPLLDRQMARPTY